MCTLVSEVSPLIIGPWLVLVVAASASSARGHSRSVSWTAMLLTALPAVVDARRLARGRAGEQGHRAGARGGRTAGDPRARHRVHLPRRHVRPEHRQGHRRTEPPRALDRRRRRARRPAARLRARSAPAPACDVRVDPPDPASSGGPGRSAPWPRPRCCSRSASTGSAGSRPSSSQACSPPAAVVALHRSPWPPTPLAPEAVVARGRHRGDRGVPAPRAATPQLDPRARRRRARLLLRE